MGKKGFDVWYRKGSINFSKVKASGIDFILPRDGWGTTGLDPKLVEYCQQAKAAGVEVPGVFHFIYGVNVAEAIENADKAIENVQAAGLPNTTVIWCDLEYDTVANARDYRGVTLTAKDQRDMVEAFCNHVLAEGYPTGIYTNRDYIENVYGKDIIDHYDIWLADLEGDPAYPCVYRQYSWKGWVDGVSEFVDLDEYYGQYTADTAKARKGGSNLSYLIMTKQEWVEYLKALARDKSGYWAAFPWNLLYWDGERFWADCHNLEKALFNGRDINDKTVGSYAWPLPATGDCTEYGLLLQCSDIRWGQFKLLKAEEPRIIYMEGHIGAYLGEEWYEDGQGTVNAVESTPAWEDGIQFSYVAPDGTRAWCKEWYQKGTTRGVWAAHGLASKWVDYSASTATQEVIDADKQAVAPEVQAQHYGTKDLAVAIIRNKLGKGYENRVANAKKLGYTEAEVRAAQDLVNKVVKTANEQKAAAEKELTVATAAYDVIAGAYGDGQPRIDALKAKYGDSLYKDIRDRVEALLAQ